MWPRLRRALSTSAAPERSKRKVGLWFGYDGTDFQAQTDSPDLERTVDSVLQQALLDSKCVLPTNVTRARMQYNVSSRTDKNVSSIASALTAKLEIPLAAFCSETGRLLDATFLERVNEQLPPTLRVFSAKRVRGSLRARFAVNERTYQYFLPPTAFDGALERVGADGVNELLRHFVGRRSFHAFTRAARASVSRDAMRPLLAQAQLDEASLDALTDNETLVARLQQLLLAKAVSLGHRPSVSTLRSDVDLLAAFAHHPAALRRRVGEIVAYKADPRMQRVVFDATCRRMSLAGGSWFVITVRGESFVHNQIRNIVGALGLLLNDVVPIEWLHSALVPSPHRVAMPLAPAENLVLTSYRSFDENLLFADGQEASEQFLNAVLLPAISTASRESAFLDAWRQALAERDYSTQRGESAAVQQLVQWWGDVTRREPSHRQQASTQQ